MKRIAGFLGVMAVVLTGCFSPFLPDDPDTSSENLPPDIDLTASSSLLLGDALTAELSATDPEGDSLSWSFSFDSLPEDSSLSTSDIDVDDTSASFTPDVIGVYVIRVSVTDGIQNVTAAVSVTVTSGAPAAPSGPKPSDALADVGIATGLEWDDAEGATSYRIYLGTDAVPTSPTATVSSSSFAPAEPFAYSTTYVWQIAAVNGYGETLGPVWEFTTQAEPLSPPAAPSGPQPGNEATDVSRDVSLNWNDATDAAGYDLQWRASGGSWNYENNLTSSSFALPQLAWDTTYEWRVTATNAAGSEQGPLWTFTTHVAPPTGFKLLSPANGATGQEAARLQLDWEDAEGAGEYDLYVGAGSLPGSPTATVTDASQYLLTGLSLDTTYVWRVVAKNDGGSTASATFGFTTALPAPAVPSNPSPSDGTTDALPGLTLDWANAANATSYDVYLRSPREKSFTRVASEITSSRYTPSDIGYGSRYEWYVVAKNAEHTTTGPTWEFGTQSNNLSYLDAGYWRFNRSLADESGFAHFTDWRLEPAYTHQVPGTSPVYTEDRNGADRSAVALSAGYGQHVIVPLGDFPDSPLANHTIGFSLSLWYREIGTHQNTSLVSRANAKVGYDLVLNSGKGLTLFADGAVVASIPDSAVQRTWNNVVLSWDFDTDQLRIWANGTPVAEEKATPFTNSTSSVYFGIPHIGSRTSTFFTGALDDIRIYSRPVSETEAEALFNE